MQNGANEWKSIGILLIVLLAVGLINAKTQKIAIGIAIIVSLLMVLKHWKKGV